MKEGLFGIAALAQMNSAIAHFMELHMYLATKSEESVEAWAKLAKINYEDNYGMEAWLQFSISCFPQKWPTKGGGWGGGGGGNRYSNIRYTTVIYNPGCRIMAVYWSGEFAYCMVDNTPALGLLSMEDIPGMNSLEKFPLQIIYKTDRYE